MGFPYFGRWSVDEKANKLLRNDRKSACFVGFVDDREDLGIINSFDRRWMRFELDLGDQPYSLLVERRDVATDSNRRNLVWRLDHIRSARLNEVNQLDYEPWLKIDRLACDALLCWPNMAETGLRPAVIAVSGGWQAGRWTAEYYRTFDTVRIEFNRAFRVGPFNVGRPQGVFPDDPAEHPQAWHFREASRTLPAIRQVELLRAFARAKPQHISDLIEKLRQVRPHLASPERMLIPFAAGGQGEANFYWLYVDELIVTNRLQTSHYSSKRDSDWSFSPWPNVIVGSIDREKGGYLFGTPAPQIWRRNHDDLRKGEGGAFPAKICARFREIVEEAIWHWQDCMVSLPGIDGIMEEVPISRPVHASIDRVVKFGGTSFCTGMSVARTKSDSSGKPLSFDLAFEESTVSVPGSTSPWVGRFDFSPTKIRMTNRVTGQTLTYERTLSGSADTSSSQAGTFQYHDDESDFSILVRRSHRRKAYEGEEWIVDCTASETIPAQHLGEERWRRAQAFIVDALLVWPDTTSFGPKPHYVVVHGGWFNRRWEPMLRQRMHSSLLLARLDRHLPSEPPERCLPHRWQYHQAPVRTDKDEEISMDTQGAVSVNPSDLKTFARERLPGRTHWIREDEKALLYICGHHNVRRGSDGDLIREPLFEYCDEDVRVRMEVTANGSISLSSLKWPRVVRSSRFEEGEGILPSKLFRVETSRIPSSCHPQELLWQRVLDATNARLIGVRTNAHSSVMTTGAYLAGAFTGTAETSLWIDAAPAMRD